MEPVSLGAGSYASVPPEQEGVTRLLSKEPALVGPAIGRALPTNDWWTNLLWEPPFPGKLYAMPLTIGADAGGLSVWFSEEWADDGIQLELGDPLRVEGAALAADDSADIVLYDFEGGAWPTGWVVKPGQGSKPDEAFGTRPMEMKDHAMRFHVGTGFACSFWGTDTKQGEAVSPEFLVQRDYLHFKVAGGDDAEVLGVHLMVDGKSVRQALGQKNNDYESVVWDLREFRGKQAQIRLQDDTSGGWGFIAADHFVMSDSPDTVSGGIFQRAATKDWGDWHVVMRLEAGDDAGADVTFGRGMPLVWIEPEGVELRIPIGADDVATELYEGAVWRVDREGKSFWVVGAGGTKILRPAGGSGLAARGAIAVGGEPQGRPDEKAAVWKAANSIPRKTEVSWTYDPAAGEAVTTWKTETSDGGEMLQGWLPHHWRVARNDLAMTGAKYATQRGELRMAKGNTAEIAWPFVGMMPALPLPALDDNGFDHEQATGFVAGWAAELAKKPKDEQLGIDTYWGGKQILKMAHGLVLARQLNDPSATQLEDTLRKSLTDWLTYTPGEPHRYFAKYPAPWNALVGFNSSFGSEQFTDNHFHYGYFTLSAAMLAMSDPAWAQEHREMLTMVAKQYANWDRNDESLPFLRTFDPWAGHSYAGGGSSGADGNNQESTSEAMMSWAGLFLLGEALGDDGMRNCGAMGYAIESEAIQEYWNNTYAWLDKSAPSNWPDTYEHSIVSVLRDRDLGYFTWFSAEPVHIYGIQWIPAGAEFHYLSRHPKHAQWQLGQMLEKQNEMGRPSTIPDLGGEWADVSVGYQAWGDPQAACATLTEAHRAGKPLGGQGDVGNSYALAHSLRALGEVAWDYHTDLPTSLVFRQADGGLVVAAWNAGPDALSITIYQAGEKVGVVEMAPGLHATEID